MLNHILVMLRNGLENVKWAHERMLKRLCLHISSECVFLLSSVEFGPAVFKMNRRNHIFLVIFFYFFIFIVPTNSTEDYKYVFE